MDSIQVIRLLDVLRVNDIRNAVGVVPRSILVRGEDFTNVESVLVNGLAAPEFVVMSDTQILAQVPEDAREATISDVAVLSSGITLTDRSMVELTFGTRPRRARGVMRLLQVFVRHLLRSPGSNVFHRRSGGGLLRRIGTNITNQAAADIAIAINATKQYIIGAQTSERNIPPSERLLSAEVGGLSVDPANSSIYVTVILTSHSGQRGAATLTA